MFGVREALDTVSSGACEGKGAADALWCRDLSFLPVVGLGQRGGGGGKKWLADVGGLDNRRFGWTFRRAPPIGSLWQMGLVQHTQHGD